MTKICILGGGGFIGSSIIKKIDSSFDICYTYQKNQLELDIPNETIHLPKDFNKLEEFLDSQKPKFIINTIGNSNPIFCEENRQNTFDLHIKFVERISKVLEKRNCRLIQFSTDYVFDGENGKYTEKDKPNPINYYGYTKYQSEKIVLKNPLNVVIRTSSVYGHNLNSRFFNFVINNLKKGKEIEIYDDIYFSPTLVDDIVKGISLIIKNSLSGIFHISGNDCMSKFHFAKKIANIFEFDETLIKSTSIKKSDPKIKYPSRTCLDSSFSSKILGTEFHSTDTGISIVKDLMKI